MINRDSLFSVPKSILSNWVFDKRVAEVFPDMIRRSIPGYSAIISMIGMLARRFVRTGTYVYDLGCSLGAVTLAVYNSISSTVDCRIIAVDNSPAMISCFRRHIETLPAMTLTEIIEDDICIIPIENASLVVLNFTLQFIKPAQRQLLLNRIYQGLHPGGALILSEKFSFQTQVINSLLFNMHHDFKRDNGYSELEIIQKNSMLENVMFTDTIEIHKNRLVEAGFSHAEVFFQHFNFGSLVAIKSQR